MGAPCLDPDKSAYEKMVEAIAYSEKNRARLDEVVAAEVEPMRRRLIAQRQRDRQMAPPDDYEVEVLAELGLASDPRYKAALSNERWGWRMATMYAGQAATVDAEVTHQLLRELISEIRNLRADVQRPRPRPPIV